MAMGDATDRLGSINPSDLIGRAVVEPRAVERLSEAFRSGFITADDIIQRSGESAQLKQKAEVQLLSEQISPEAIAARAAQRDAAVAQAGLQSASATAQTPLVGPTAELQRRQLETEAAYQKYPAARLFDQYAPVLGLEEPVTPDKQIDWSRKASIGIQIGEHIRLQSEAKEKLANITTEKSADGSVIAAFTKQGLPVETTEVQRLDAQARSPFRGISPGTAASPAAVVTPAAMATPDLVERDRQLTALLPSTAPTVIPATSTATANPVVEPKMGQPVVGGFSLGPPKAKDASEKLLPSEGVANLTKLQQARDLAQRLGTRYQDLINSEPNLVGFIQGRVATWAKSKEWNEKVAAFERDAEAILNPAARSLLGETGVLSDKDVARYKGIIPTLRDSPKIGNQKITDLHTDSQRSVERNLDTWKRAGYDVSGFQDLIGTPGGAAQTTPAPGASGGVLQLPSTGRRIVRDANGQYRLVQ